MKGQTTKVLLIEDDADDAFLIRESFGEVDRDSVHFQVKLAPTLQGGLDILAKEPMDVVILDLLLKGTEGFDAIVRVRNQSPSIPVVVLTGLDDEYIALEALSHGAQDYLVKGSIDAQLLVRSIRYAIERSQLLTRLEQSSEDRFLKIIDKSADAMAVIDKEGIVRFVNPACQFLFEQRPEEIVGKPFPLSLAINPLAEFDVVLKNGDKKIVQMRVSDIEWEKKPAKLASIRDITTLQKLESLKREMNERKKMDQMKDEFISTVSHELRTPLTTIKSAVENLKDGVSGAMTEKQERVIDIANRNVDRLARIINDLLDLSRLESGKAKIYKRSVNAIPLLQESLQNFQMTAKERHLILEGNFPKGLPPIYADADMFVQVLTNLLDNALRFAKTKVSVEAKAEGQDIEVTVADDGIGIPEEKIKVLFSKFVQLDRPMGGEGYKGTGLGLAICKEIVDHHAGRIWVTSQVKHGAQFHFTMRQYREEADFKDILQQAFKGMGIKEGEAAFFVITFDNLTNLKKKFGAKEFETHFNEIEGKIRKQVLRKGDVLLNHLSQGQLILIAATTSGGAASIQQRIETALQGNSPFRIAMSLYPEEAQEPEKLIEVALAKTTGEQKKYGQQT